MTTTKIDVSTYDQKEQQRKKIQKQIQRFLDNGGVITQCPRNAFTVTDPDGKPTKKKRFDKHYTPDSMTDPTQRTHGAFLPSKSKE